MQSTVRVLAPPKYQNSLNLSTFIDMKCTPKVRQTNGGAFLWQRKDKHSKKYSPEFKISVIMDMSTNGLSYHETVRKYNLGDDSIGGTRQMVHRWERIYLEEGIEGFMKQRRGRPPKSGKPKKPLDKSVEEDLIAENQRLKERLQYVEAELEYLKKLDALIRAEEQEKNKKQ